MREVLPFPTIQPSDACLPAEAQPVPNQRPGLRWGVLRQESGQDGFHPKGMHAVVAQRGDRIGEANEVRRQRSADRSSDREWFGRMNEMESTQFAEDTVARLWPDVG